MLTAADADAVVVVVSTIGKGVADDVPAAASVVSLLVVVVVVVVD